MIDFYSMLLTGAPAGGPSLLGVGVLAFMIFCARVGGSK